MSVSASACQRLMQIFDHRNPFFPLSAARHCPNVMTYPWSMIIATGDDIEDTVLLPLN
jgi:hypothetical protein